MKITELKTQVAHGSYEVDERLVAEAVLRRLAPWRYDVLPPSSRRGARNRPTSSRPRR